MTKRLTELPQSERPRAKLLQRGADALKDNKLVAILLGSGAKGHDVMRVARRIVRMVNEYHGHPDVADLQRVTGVGPAKAALIAAALEFARRRIRPEGLKIESPTDVLPLLRHYSDRRQEHFVSISLNGAHEVITTRVVSIGLVNQTQVHAREVFADPITDRAYEFGLLDKWLNFIPKRLSKSRVILARRKSGKTAIVQRIFNMLWNEKRGIIPFYYNIAEVKTWFPYFAIDYYRTFASHYIAFREKNEHLVRHPMRMDEIREYGQSRSIKLLVDDVDVIRVFQAEGGYDLVWKKAYSAPDRFANYYEQSILVIVDEFQNITQYIYRDEAYQSEPDKSMAGSFHDVVESKQAPMLVTGSYVGWLIEVIGRSLQADRLRRMLINPYLTPEEGLRAVYKYAEYLNQPITNETAEQINQLCMHDPFFISCVIKSEYPGKDLSTADGVVNAVNYEITDESSEMSMTWGEYIEQTADKINEREAKNILLHLSKHSHRDWTANELKEALNLSSGPRQIREKLETMVKADVIKRGRGDIRYKGLNDGTIYLILRHRFEEEISEFTPDLKESFNQQIAQLQKDKKALQGRLNHLVGQFAEFQLFIDFRTRQHFSLSVYTDPI